MGSPVLTHMGISEQDGKDTGSVSYSSHPFVLLVRPWSLTCYAYTLRHASTCLLVRLPSSSLPRYNMYPLSHASSNLLLNFNRVQPFPLTIMIAPSAPSGKSVTVAV